MAIKKKNTNKATSKKLATKRVVLKKATPKKIEKTTVKTSKKVKAVASADANLLNVIDMSGKQVESIQLDPIFQGHDINTDVIYQTVLMYQAGEREGTAATKDRGHVRGGGKKPWKQKGTGQARHGSRRSPIWRGGGVTFGPMPRDYSYVVPQQIRRRAVIEGVKDKLANKGLIVINDIKIEKPKTKLVAKFMEALKLQKPLFLVDQKAPNFLLAARNIRQVSIKTASEVNVLDVVSHKECVITKAAYSGLVKRLKS